METTVRPGGTLSSGEYFGHVLGRNSAGGFAWTETSYRAGEDLPPHAHERAFFSLTLAGGYTERTGAARETHYGPFTAVFHPAGEVHVTRMGPEGGRVFNVEVEPALATLAAAPARDLRGADLVWGLAQLRRHSREGGTGDALESLGLDLVGAVCTERPESRAAPPWLPLVLQWLHDEPERRVSVAALARDAGVHPVHLARVFRRHVGETVPSYTRRLRVQRAASLATRGRGLAEVASLSGFADQSHMTHAFLRVTGTTPGRLLREKG